MNKDHVNPRISKRREELLQEGIKESSPEGYNVVEGLLTLAEILDYYDKRKQPVPYEFYESIRKLLSIISQGGKSIQLEQAKMYKKQLSLVDFYTRVVGYVKKFKSLTDLQSHAQTQLEDCKKLLKDIEALLDQSEELAKHHAKSVKDFNLDTLENYCWQNNIDLDQYDLQAVEFHLKDLSELNSCSIKQVRLKTGEVKSLYNVDVMDFLFHQDVNLH